MRLASPVQGLALGQVDDVVNYGILASDAVFRHGEHGKKWSLSRLHSLMVCCDSYQIIGEIHLSTQVNSLCRELRL